MRRSRSPAASPRAAAGGESTVAVVIPVLGDTEELRRLLASMDAWTRRAEEIVVVAAETSPELERSCRERGAKLVAAPANRGAQLDRGARESSASILWFLHADSEVPPAACAALVNAIFAGAESGCFAFSFQGRATLTKRVLCTLIALRVGLGGTPYGDQALFATREAYERCGGFAPQPLFEETRLVKRLRGRRTFKPLREHVRVSPRRWERDGWWRRSLHNRWLALRYMLGTSAERLAAAYGPHRTQTPPTDDMSRGTR